MTGKKEGSTGRRSSQKVTIGAGRASDPLLEDTELTFDIQAVRRLCRDAYLILSLFPAKMCYSYYVDRNGRLRCLADRRDGS